MQIKFVGRDVLNVFIFFVLQVGHPADKYYSGGVLTCFVSNIKFETKQTPLFVCKALVNIEAN